jgi:hypothetical protein
VEFSFSELMSSYIIWKNNVVALVEKGLNFDVRKLGGLHEKHTVTTSNLGTVSAFAKRQKKMKKTRVEMASRSGFWIHIDF